MKVSISNIAWNPEEDENVAGVLRRHGLERIDIAPSKYFADFTTAGQAEIAAVREAWEDRGQRLYGMQSLLFGTQGLNLFGDDGAMLDRLGGVCRLAGRLGIRVLTFGSPKNRDRGARTHDQALEEAVAFFRLLGAAAEEAGVVVCLEPNPVAYGCNFMTTTDETAAVVRATGHAHIRLQLDLGAIAMNGEDPAAMIERHGDIIAHVHASEPGLAPLQPSALHDAAGEALRRLRPDLTVTIEMVGGEGVRLDTIERAVAAATAAYGDRNAG